MLSWRIFLSLKVEHIPAEWPVLTHGLWARVQIADHCACNDNTEGAPRREPCTVRMRGSAHSSS